MAMAGPSCLQMLSVLHLFLLGSKMIWVTADQQWADLEDYGKEKNLQGLFPPRTSLRKSVGMAEGDSSSSSSSVASEGQSLRNQKQPQLPTTVGLNVLRSWNVVDGNPYASGKWVGVDSPTLPALEQRHPEDTTHSASYSRSTGRNNDTSLTTVTMPSTVRNNDTSPTTVTMPNTDNTTYMMTEVTTEYDYPEYDYPEPLYRQLSFTKTLYLCEYLFSAMYGEYTSFPDSGIMHNNQSVIVMYEKKFLNVCSPFYKAFNRCEDKGNITFCEDENVVLFHQHGCKRFSSEDVYFEHLLAATLLKDDKMCFQEVCSGTIRVLDRAVEGIQLRFINPGQIHTSESCSSFLRHYHSVKKSEVVYVTRNIYWPCCYPDFVVLWSEDPQQHGLVATWSYLPIYCKAPEVVFMVVIAITVICGVVGNIIVLVVLLGNRSLNEQSNVLHTSLALSDLFLSLFVIAPAFHFHLAALNGYIEETVRCNNQEEVAKLLESQQIKASVSIIESGFYLFSSLIMSSCSINSLLSLFALSFQRFVVTGEISKFKEFCTPVRIKSYVILSWIWGLIVSLLLMYDDNGITSMWYSFYKLPLGVSTTGQKMALPVVIVILGIVCLLTIVFSGLSVFYYQYLKRKRSDQEERTEEADEVQNRRKVCCVTLTMVLMTVLFFLSTVPAGVAAVIQAKQISFPYLEMVTYICWWGFLASTSWNPWLYNFGSKQFREDATETFKCLVGLLAPLRGRSWVPRFVNNSQSRDDSNREDVDLSAQQRLRRRRRRVAMPGVRQFSYREEAV